MSVVSPAMRAYYERRAAEYDDWWLGTGRFATRERPGWAAEVERLRAVVRDLAPARVLDVACGTGFLTRELRGEVTGVDQSEAMVVLAAGRVPAARVLRADAAALPFPDASFDRVLTSHFYGHLLPEERAPVLAELRRVGSELVVVDSGLGPGQDAETWEERILDDGSRHRVYKRRFTADGLAAELGGGEVLHAGRWFVVVRSGASG
jgi:demethylmenaquinone methyltransferase/2-methoxy-6-polyprenyl-1,4-benzoquinol methylase